MPILGSFSGPSGALRIIPLSGISKLDLLEDMEDIHYNQGTYQAIGYDFVLSIEELLPFESIAN